MGLVGVRAGAITAACDHVRVTLSGPGGHTARPHLTADVVYALGKIVTELPAALTRRVDPRAGLSLVWGRCQRGDGGQRDPGHGRGRRHRALPGHRGLARRARPDREIAQSVAQPYGVTAKVEYTSAASRRR